MTHDGRPVPPKDDHPVPDGAGAHAVQTAIDVATFIGSAGIGGVIGNRADAAVVSRARGIFAAVRDRWLGREGDALTERDAVDAAEAAALTIGYAAGDLRVESAERRDDGSWLIRFRAGGQILRATVPSGDPMNARILITERG